MNKNNAAAYLPLVQALLEGKTIQRQAEMNPDIWYDVSETNFMSGLYRIKPEEIK